MTGNITMNGDRLSKPTSPDRKASESDESGPTRPTIERPEGGNELMKRLKKVDPDQAKRYRQRSGQ